MRTAVAICILAYAAVSWFRSRNALCGDVAWLPFEDESGFGYCDWFCELLRGHPGDHFGTIP